MSEEKIRVKLEKIPLESERKEIKERKKRTWFLIALCVVLLGLGFLGGYLFTHKIKVEKNLDFESKVAEIEYCFDKSWLYKYDYEDLNTELENRALYNMTFFAEDPYTTYMSADEMKEFANSINMDYVGIGIQYQSLYDTITVTRVYKDSPAEKAGLLPGDIIKKVAGEDVDGLTTDEIKELALGEEGTVVTITVNRGGNDIDIDVVRGAIDSTVYAYAKDDYVILELLSFGTTTSDECIKYLNDYRDYKKIIIDLRNNGGGYQTAVLQVAGLFLGEDKLVMTEEFNNGDVKFFKTIADEYYDNFESIILLTNGDTASAAEVLTAALKQQHPNAIQVGTTTFGKGVVQSNYYLSDGSCLKITSSKWLAPNGEWYNEIGIEPDYVVELHDVLYSYYPSMEEDEKYEIDSVGEAVRIAELCFDYLDYKVNRTDGYFDESFAELLKEYQTQKGLEADGVLNQKTYETLITDVASQYSRNKEKDPQLMKAIELLENQ